MSNVIVKMMDIAGIRCFSIEDAVNPSAHMHVDKVGQGAGLGDKRMFERTYKLFDFLRSAKADFVASHPSTVEKVGYIFDGEGDQGPGYYLHDWSA